MAVFFMDNHFYDYVWDYSFGMSNFFHNNIA